jgi:hypothetical protein
LGQFWVAKEFESGTCFDQHCIKHEMKNPRRENDSEQAQENSIGSINYVYPKRKRVIKSVLV